MPPASPRRLIALAFACLGLSSDPARASEMFNVARLGDSFSIQRDEAGVAHGVTGGDGQAYAFDKQPVTRIYERTPLPFYIRGVELDKGEYTQYDMRNGDYKVGYLYEQRGDFNTFASFSTDWYGYDRMSPVSDLNIHGQAVGRAGSMAVFSDVGLKAHEDHGDYLYRHLTEDLGKVILNSGLWIDDFGRIIASGTEDYAHSQYFLLTPTSLPAPTPEPSTAIVFAVAAIGLGFRRLRSCRN